MLWVPARILRRRGERIGKRSRQHKVAAERARCTIVMLGTGEVDGDRRRKGCGAQQPAVTSCADLTRVSVRVLDALSS